MQTAVLYLGDARQPTSPIAPIPRPRHATQRQFPVAGRRILARFAAEFANGPLKFRRLRKIRRSLEWLEQLQPTLQPTEICLSIPVPGDSLPVSCPIGRREWSP